MEGSTLTQILAVFDKMVEEAKGLNLPPLGPSFKHLEPVQLHEALVVHRMTKSYEVPNVQSADTRKQLSISEVLRADENGWSRFNYRDLPISSRTHFLEAQNWLRVFFKDFKHSYALRFPTGETFVSARGLTDLIDKLRSLDQWAVSPELVDYVVEILLRNRSLLAVVKQRYREKYGLHGKKVLADLRLKCILLHPKEGVKHLRRHMTRFMFRAVCVLNRTSRVTTVPKDNSRDRVITCESLWTMVAQLSYAASLRDHMRLKLGFDLESRQGVHRALIRAGGATIDLSKASDRNYMCVLRELWPIGQYKYLEAMRTGIFEVISDDGVEYVPLNMFAPMGCGCTFEVMTLTLLAHARVLDPGASVFGDDIIIKQAHACQLITNLENCGWLINTSKSFIDGPFRESCGAFCDLRLNKLLLSYDFHRPSDLPGCYLLAHKMLQVGQSLSQGPVRSLLVRIYAELVKLFPRDSFGLADSVSYRPTAGLTDFILYVSSSVLGCRVQRQTSVTRCLETFWQRPIGVTMCHVVEFGRREQQLVADRTLTAAYLRRGTAYAVPNGKSRIRQVPTDAFSGVPLRNVLLATVI